MQTDKEEERRPDGRLSSLYDVDTVMERIDDILDRYGKLLERIDEWFARCMEALPDEISCGTGCSECCRGMFDITLLDSFYLRRGLERLPDAERLSVIGRAEARLAGMHRLWPEYESPYILNLRPESDWDDQMPDDDERPCVFLDEAGKCLCYGNRPMTCRLHGLPLLDLSGEIMHDEWCTLNFSARSPLGIDLLRADFDTIFREEVRLLRELTTALFGRVVCEIDTVIPAAAVVEYGSYAWGKWWQRYGEMFESMPPPEFVSPDETVPDRSGG